MVTNDKDNSIFRSRSLTKAIYIVYTRFPNGYPSGKFRGNSSTNFRGILVTVQNSRLLTENLTDICASPFVLSHQKLSQRLTSNDWVPQAKTIVSLIYTYLHFLDQVPGTVHTSPDCTTYCIY